MAAARIRVITRAKVKLSRIARHDNTIVSKNQRAVVFARDQDPGLRIYILQDAYLISLDVYIHAASYSLYYDYMYNIYVYILVGT